MRKRIGYYDFGFKTISVLFVSAFPQWLKRPIYRLCGYKIGKGAIIGFCSVILCDDVNIGDYAVINPFAVLKIKQLHMGDYSWIGSFTFCYGNGSLRMGRFSAVGMKVLLNSEKDIFIDDHAFIGQYSNLYTHSVALPYTKGYPRRFADITIGRNVRISARATVMPGVTIGENTWIGPQSLVNKDLPANVFAGGVPAKIIHEDVKKIFDSVDDQELKRRTMEMVTDFLKTNDIEISRTEADSGILVLKDGRATIVIDMPVCIDEARRYILILFGDVDVTAYGKNVSWFDFKNYKARLNCRISKEMRNFFWSHYGERIEIA